MKNASSRYSGDLKFCMAVDDVVVKYCPKFERNAPSTFEATTQNRMISVFTVSKMYLLDTVEP